VVLSQKWGVLQFLLSAVSNDDIKKALFSIGDDKSPRPDGYSSLLQKVIGCCGGGFMCCYE